MITLVVGLPGSGKTTYALKLVADNRFAVHLNGDAMRADLSEEAAYGVARAWLLENVAGCEAVLAAVADVPAAVLQAMGTPAGRADIRASLIAGLRPAGLGELVFAHAFIAIASVVNRLNRPRDCRRPRHRASDRR
jgi:hypothetical protein